MATMVAVVQWTGNADQEDRRAMELEIGRENARRASLNPPLAALPLSTSAERKSSYETLFVPKVTAAHQASIAESNVTTLADIKSVWSIGTDAQRAAALAALQS